MGEKRCSYRGHRDDDIPLMSLPIERVNVEWVVKIGWWWPRRDDPLFEWVIFILPL